jgi:hypothetical protein
MTEAVYPKGSTALLFIDPYNDFLAEGGKMWPALREVAGSVSPASDASLHVAARVQPAFRDFAHTHAKADPKFAPCRTEKQLTGAVHTCDAKEKTTRTHAGMKEAKAHGI